MRPGQADFRAIPVAEHGADIREARVARGTGPPSGTDEIRPDCLLAGARQSRRFNPRAHGALPRGLVFRLPGLRCAQAAVVLAVSPRDTTRYLSSPELFQGISSGTRVQKRLSARPAQLRFSAGLAERAFRIRPTLLSLCGSSRGAQDFRGRTCGRRTCERRTRTQCPSPKLARSRSQPL
jgi:hypothetical protein